jgi:hypothetical protein
VIIDARASCKGCGMVFLLFHSRVADNRVQVRAGCVRLGCTNWPLLLCFSRHFSTWPPPTLPNP